MSEPTTEVVLVSSAPRWGIDPSDLDRFQDAVIESIKSLDPKATVRFLQDGSGQRDEFLDEGRPSDILKRQVQEIVAYTAYQFADED